MIADDGDQLRRFQHDGTTAKCQQPCAERRVLPNVECDDHIVVGPVHDLATEVADERVHVVDADAHSTVQNRIGAPRVRIEVERCIGVEVVGDDVRC